MTTRAVASFGAPGLIIWIDYDWTDPLPYAVRSASTSPDDPEPQYKETHTSQTPQSAQAYADQLAQWWERKGMDAGQFERISEAVRRSQELGAGVSVWPRLDEVCEDMGAPEWLDADGRPWWTTEDFYLRRYLNRDGYLEFRSLVDEIEILDALEERGDTVALSWLHTSPHHVPTQGIGGRWVFVAAPEPTLEEWIHYVIATAPHITGPRDFPAVRMQGHEDDDPILELHEEHTVLLRPHGDHLVLAAEGTAAEPHESDGRHPSLDPLPLGGGDNRHDHGAAWPQFINRVLVLQRAPRRGHNQIGARESVVNKVRRPRAAIPHRVLVRKGLRSGVQVGAGQCRSRDGPRAATGSTVQQDWMPIKAENVSEE